jgi:FkbM family methyltransferase
METIFDIGMFDAQDTAYYLELGYTVIAVEANPALANEARVRFAAELESGQLTVLNLAVTADGSPADLMVSQLDLGSSSIFQSRVEGKRSAGSITVPGTTINNLLREHGTPKFLKIDIEGADRYCVLPLNAANRPNYLSFEVGDDADELLGHAARIGYVGFKIINQLSFRGIANLDSIQDRVIRKLAYLMGYAEPRKVRRAGRFFVSGHSSGPVPWLSDGRWQSIDEIRRIIGQGSLPGWSDIHASALDQPT